MHIAVLLENEEIVDFLASNFKATLHIGDNLARTPLHYAMGVNNVEAISRILIKNGAKRVVKDLKGRQPSVSQLLLLFNVITFEFILREDYKKKT